MRTRIRSRDLLWKHGYCLQELLIIWFEDGPRDRTARSRPTLSESNCFVKRKLLIFNSLRDRRNPQDLHTPPQISLSRLFASTYQNRYPTENKGLNVY